MGRRPVRYSLMSANVGEWTRSVAPTPAATPRTNCVLPAPRSPWSPTIMPGCARSPNAWPRAAVCSGLVEMCVAMDEQRFDALLVAQLNAGRGGDFSDARKFERRKFLFPGVEEFHRIFARDREEKFEIFAVSERGEQRRLGGRLTAGLEFGGAADRNRGRKQFGAGAAGV